MTVKKHRLSHGARMKISPQPTTIALLLVAAWSLRVGAAPSGSISVANGSINTTGTTTTVSLNQSSRIDWSNLSLTNNETLRYVSTGGAGFASLNIVSGGRSFIDGNITADGPFLLINPAGIVVGGSIAAPQILLSTLSPSDPTAALTGSSTSWASPGFGTVQVSGTLSATTSLTILSETINILPPATLRTTDTANGSVNLIAADSGVTGNTGSWTVAEPSAGQSGTINQAGNVTAHSVRLISHGSLVNSGNLSTGGRSEPIGDQVLLRAIDIVHEVRGRISARHVLYEGDPTPVILGLVVNPDDGSNPSATSSTVQLPSLTGGKPLVITKFNPGQLSYTHLKTLQVAAPTPRAKPSSKVVAMRRGTGSSRTPEKATKPTKATRPTVQRSSFFGKICTTPWVID
jgi:filamentous hemagglutinin family protein